MRVTGAASGNGQAIAHGIAREGAHVVIPDVNQPGAEATAQEIAALGRNTLVLNTDVRMVSDIDAMVKAVMDQFGRIDILVNNAGVITRQPMLEITDETWDRILDINLKGMFFCTQGVARVMIRQGKGKIVNIRHLKFLSRSTVSRSPERSEGAAKRTKQSLLLQDALRRSS